MRLCEIPGNSSTISSAPSPVKKAGKVTNAEKIKTAKAVYLTRPCLRKIPAAKISKPINELTIGK